jgi:hypothetical protein
MKKVAGAIEVSVASLLWLCELVDFSMVKLVHWALALFNLNATLNDSDSSMVAVVAVEGKALLLKLRSLWGVGHMLFIADGDAS